MTAKRATRNTREAAAKRRQAIRDRNALARQIHKHADFVDVGDRLAELMQDYIDRTGIRQIDLARRAAISQQQVQKILSLDIAPTSRTISRLLFAMGYKPASLGKRAQR